MLVYVVIFVLLVLLAWVYIKYSYYKCEYLAQKDMYNYYKNKMSMIEYHYRNYREGVNPYTVMRKMGDIIQDYYVKLGNGDD